MEEASGKVSDIGVMVVTTYFVNALGVAIRADRVIRPFALGPAFRRSPLARPDRWLDGHYRLIHGGWRWTSEIAALNRDELCAGRHRPARRRHRNPLSSVFLPSLDMEEQAFDIITEAFPDQSVTKSTDIGRLGLPVRETAAIINGALRLLAAEVVESFLALAEELDLQCPLDTKNDGTLISADHQPPARAIRLRADQLDAGRPSSPVSRTGWSPMSAAPP